MANSGQFKPGHRPPGKPKGAISHKRRELQEVMADKGFNPAEAFMYLYEKAVVGIENGDRDEKPKYIKIAADIVTELASYSYPKLKAIEITKKNPFEGMSPAQRLEAMRQAVALLEHEVGNAKAAEVFVPQIESKELEPG